ncbi:MAG: universal stress protein [Nitrososphaerales archaeon]
MKQKILVPHDGCEMSDKALGHAIAIAGAMRMEIIILRVVPPVIDGPAFAFLSEKERKRIKRERARINREVKTQIHDSLEKQLTRCTSEDVKASGRVIIGEPIEKILSVGGKEKPYLIVMGSRRLKGMAKLKVLGSVARKVSEEAKCPVTIVH